MTGRQLRDALISGANNLTNKKKEVDALNVFPVPDGDTGTNMSMTAGNGVLELSKLGDDVTVAEVSKVASGAFLRGARGNSGVILSLLFRGFAKGLKEKETADGKDLAEAFSLGVEAAYKKVMKPTEGTILTVARCASEKAADIMKFDDSVSAVFYGMFVQAQKTLEQTPEMLPILKKSGVVDAGGQGLVYMMEGMWSYLTTGSVVSADAAGNEDEMPSDVTYCVEIELTKNGDFASKLENELSALGELLLFDEDEKAVRFHLHTAEPDKALGAALGFGTLSTTKVENINIKHTSLFGEKKASAETENPFPYAAVDPETAYGFVSVCAGAGLTDLFRDLGCDRIVSGGQTMNPSTEDILAAVQSVPAKTVFVLPNNKNIIMAATQAAEIADRTVLVIPSRTVPQGISALLAYDPDAPAGANTEAMTAALSAVVTGQVTFAARDSDFDGHKIKEGELLAMKEGKMLYTGKDMDTICGRLAKAMVTKDTSVVTVYYGADVTEEQAEAIRDVIAGKLPSGIEVYSVYGGQPVYYFIISAE